MTESESQSIRGFLEARKIGPYKYQSCLACNIEDLCHWAEDLLEERELLRSWVRFAAITLGQIKRDTASGWSEHAGECLNVLPDDLKTLPGWDVGALEDQP